MEKKYSNILTIVLVLAIVAILGVLIYLGIKLIGEPSKIRSEAEEAVEEFNQNTPDTSNSTSEESDISLEDALNNLGEDEVSSLYQKNEESTTDTYYNGYKVIGTISIPSIDLNYPILEENSSRAEKNSIIVTYPKNPKEALNKVGNVVFSGHNYQNGTFFSNISKLSTGSKIYIKDYTGNKVQYSVYNMYETSDSDFDFASRDTEGRREITLYTCSGEAGRRIVVYASEIT
jgi:LPXTG-site transpeptidase (sortase) family protein